MMQRFPFQTLAAEYGLQYYKVEVEVEVEVQGDAQAGLILFYNPSLYVGLGISDKTLWAGERGQMKKNGSPAMPRKTVFCLVSDHNEVDFLAGPDRNSLKKVYCSINVSGYTHQTMGGYLDLRPALYSAGNGQAVFRHFKYTPIK